MVLTTFLAIMPASLFTKERISETQGRASPTPTGHFHIRDRQRVSQLPSLVTVIGQPA